jgi:hypothetical protein
MRVRVTDKDSFYYGLTGTLGAACQEYPHVMVDLDLEIDDEDAADHWVHIETVTPLAKTDPEYDGIVFEDEEDDDDEEYEIEECPKPLPLIAVADSHRR